MGCNCGSKSSLAKTYVYTSPTGQVQKFKTEIEAQAAKIRNGGGTYRAS
jgi:hypothetical protein